MTARRLEGKPVRDAIFEQVKGRVDRYFGLTGKRPGLAVVLVGNNPASQIYVSNKAAACDQLGILSWTHALPDTVSQTEFDELIDSLNNSSDIDGILIQLPLPVHLDVNRLLHAINPVKDVDGFHPMNLGQLFLGQPGIYPCTPHGILKILEHYEIPTSGKHAVVLGRSHVVGKPVAALLSHSDVDATVTLCHSKTENLHGICRSADIIIAAMGKPYYVTADMVKPGAVIVDVGINRMEDPGSPKGVRVVGDVHPDVWDVASAMTPVPGGVGLVTIAMLMHNTVNAFCNRYHIRYSS